MRDTISGGSEQRTRVAHIITGLDTGGAEMMLYQLLSRADRNSFDLSVLSLTGRGELASRIEALGIPVATLDLTGPASAWSGWRRLVAWLRRQAPDVVQTWMYHADLLGGLAARWAGPYATVWGLHTTTLERATVGWRTILVTRVCSKLSHRIPTRIVCCANTSRALHARMGYPEDRMEVIHNGFDLNQFKADPAARVSVRQELGIPDGVPIIGLIGRYAAQKDHRCFIDAAARLGARLADVRFLLAGRDVTWENETLAGQIRATGLGARCSLLGLRSDVARLMASLDVLTSSSAYGEAFPMVVGEAMACEVPCVVTDVGDSAFLIGDTGEVVPARAPGELADAWHRLLGRSASERLALGEAARRRIATHFSLPEIVRRYESVYADVVGPR